MKLTLSWIQEDLSEKNVDEAHYKKVITENLRLRGFFKNNQLETG